MEWLLRPTPITMVQQEIEIVNLKGHVGLACLAARIMISEKRSQEESSDKGDRKCLAGQIYTPAEAGLNIPFLIIASVEKNRRGQNVPSQNDAPEKGTG